VRLRYCVLAGLLLSAAGSQGQPARWTIREAPVELRPLIARADLMIAAMQDSIVRELSDKFEQGGADLAINSCHIDSALVAHRIGREGAAAGRTSDRLRNPTNVPPRWALPVVTEYAGHRSRDVEGFAVDLGDKVGVMRPISERRICGNCHGPVEGLSPRIRAVLADRYPADKATGFREGEIRGWFWVEVPKSGR